MNVKFRMPRFWRQPKQNGIFKELLLTFIGTTLSIVLTFGTAQYLEHKQLREDGRQTAMMVIHDMENTAEYFRSLAETEATQYTITQYVVEHIDRLNSFSRDTLAQVYTYLMGSKTAAHHYDDSNEKLFLSSQDVWKNIDNPTFIDVAQNFFYERRYMFENINEWELFVSPIPYHEGYDYSLEHINAGFDYADFLSERLKRPVVKLFILGSSQRQQDLTNKVSTIENYIKRCKFIMDISDDELTAYLNKRKHGGVPLHRNQLIGRWLISDTMDGRQEFEFKSNDTIVATIIYHIAYAHYTGRVDIQYDYVGTWEINGDSLIMTYQNVRSCSMDTTHIHCLPDKQKEVSKLIAKWNSQLELALQPGAIPAKRDAWAAFCDSKGQRIEVWRITDSGKEECDYITKIMD